MLTKKLGFLKRLGTPGKNLALCRLNATVDTENESTHNNKTRKRTLWRRFRLRMILRVGSYVNGKPNGFSVTSKNFSELHIC